jgi:hypothetical protein
MTGNCKPTLVLVTGLVGHSNFCMVRTFQGVLDLDAKVFLRAFKVGVLKKQLNGPDAVFFDGVAGHAAMR